MKSFLFKFYLIQYDYDTNTINFLINPYYQSVNPDNILLRIYHAILFFFLNNVTYDFIFIVWSFFTYLQ